MTDDEKQRVESLLADLNSLADIPEDEATQVYFHKRIKYHWLIGKVTFKCQVIGFVFIVCLFFFLGCLLTIREQIIFICYL